MKKYKVGVIGAGNMGNNHIRVYSELPGVDLVAISDVNPETSNDLATKYIANFYYDYTKMIETEELDIVSICVPTNLHYEVAKYCLEKKINVLLEKPIAANIEDAEELLELSKTNNVKLLVGHIERFNPAVKKVKEIIDSGKIGDITAIVARRVGIFPPQIKDANVAVDLSNP